MDDENYYICDSLEQNSITKNIWISESINGTKDFVKSNSIVFYKRIGERRGLFRAKGR